MKKIYALIVLSLISFAGWGQIVFHEPFNYTPDAVNGLHLQSGGVWVRLNTGDSILVEAGNLSYAGLEASSGNKIKFDGGGSDNYREFTSQTAGKIYSSFILNIPALGSLNTVNGGYFAGFVQAASTSNFGATVWVRKSATPQKFNIGIAPRTTNTTISWLPLDLDTAANHLVVTSYEIITGTANDIAQIWVNPSALGGGEPAAGATVINTGGTDLASVGRFLIRQDNSTNTPFIEMDEIRVGTTWASVTPTGVVIPVPTTTSISPASAVAGSAAFTITVNGTNFISGQSTVTWNGSTRTTSFVSATQLTADITAADIASPGTALVGVTTTGAASVSNTQSFTIDPPPTPLLTATNLSGFGDVCINTSSAPASFTISGTNLSSSNITVGPLAGFSFSTLSAGPYSGSLSLAQPGGNFSQEVFVKFEPSLVQSYNGNIAVGGGGAAPINVAATGAGINTLASINAGAATAITTTGATLPATITIAGCGTISTYGFEYSTTSGFANGTGTQVVATNLASGSFSVTLSTLSPNTTYYYKAFVANGAGTSYSTELSFTTAGIAPLAPVATAASAITFNGFTANWNAVAGATVYYLDVYTMGTGGNADTVAGWNFATNTAANQTADEGNGNNLGIQTISGVGVGTISWPGGPTSLSGANPYTVSANGWDNGADTKYWLINVNTSGVSGLTISSLQGSSNTGPGSFKIQFKVGASGTWTDVPGGTVSITGPPSAGNPSTFYGPTDLPLPSAVDNQAQVSIRWLQTSNVAVNGSVVASGGTSRISAIYIKGAGTGSVPVYVPGFNNLNVGNVTSYTVSPLSASTTYYYVVRAGNAAGISPSSNEISVITAPDLTPNYSATTLEDFGGECLNNTSIGRSFTLTGNNLTNANVNIGPLNGFSFSTSVNGTYTSSLSLSQPGGSFSQVIYVKLTPISVQSYSGNIPVTGGGVTAAFNVPVTGQGLNTKPSLTTGSATSVTHNSATLHGTISGNGCSVVSAYGFEYSTVNNFPEGSGTQVTSTNIVIGSYSADISGLLLSTTYYFRAFAINAGGTAYGSLQNFTTLAAPPVTLTATPLASIGNVCVNSSSAASSFTLNGANLTNSNIVIGPLAGYSFSTSMNGTYTSTLSIAQPGGTFTQPVFVKLTPTAAQSYNGNIPVSGGGSTPFSVAVTGAGVNTPPVVGTVAAASITSQSAVLGGGITDAGCSPITTYGIEYSAMPGFAAGSGTQVFASNLAGGSFSTIVNGFIQGTTYYFRAFANNGGGVAYGEEKQFTVASIPEAFTIYPVPVKRGSTLYYSMKNISQGNHSLRIFNSTGAEVFRKNFNVQGNFINENLLLPFNLAPGVYYIRLNSDTRIIDRKAITVF